MSNFKLAVVLNGPPGCGKDTIANEIVKQYGFIKHQFKDALYEHTAKHFKVDLDKLINYASNRQLKDSTSLAGLGGRTPRQALIHASEDIYKPREGNDYFGKVEAARIRELAGRLDKSFTVIYPDGGFASELLAIESVFDHVIVLRLHRAGFDFEGDSRSHVYLPCTEKRSSFDVQVNAGEFEQSVQFCMNHINAIKEWYNVL